MLKYVCLGLVICVFFVFYVLREFHEFISGALPNLVIRGKYLVKQNTVVVHRVFFLIDSGLFVGTACG